MPSKIRVILAHLFWCGGIKYTTLKTIGRKIQTLSDL